MHRPKNLMTILLSLSLTVSLLFPNSLLAQAIPTIPENVYEMDDSTIVDLSSKYGENGYIVWGIEKEGSKFKSDVYASWLFSKPLPPIPIGESRSTTVIIKNNRSKGFEIDPHIDLGNDTEHFYLSGHSKITIPPQGVTSFNVIFKPKTYGNKQARLYINTEEQIKTGVGGYGLELVNNEYYIHEPMEVPAPMAAKYLAESIGLNQQKFLKYNNLDSTSKIPAKDTVKIKKSHYDEAIARQPQPIDSDLITGMPELPDNFENLNEQLIQQFEEKYGKRGFSIVYANPKTGAYNYERYDIYEASSDIPPTPIDQSRDKIIIIKNNRNEDLRIQPHINIHSKGYFEHFILSKPNKTLLKPQEVGAFSVTLKPKEIGYKRLDFQIHAQEQYDLETNGHGLEPIDDQYYALKQYSSILAKNLAEELSDSLNINPEEFLQYNNFEDSTRIEHNQIVKVSKFQVDQSLTKKQSTETAPPSEPIEEQEDQPKTCAPLGNSKLHNEFGLLPVEAGIIECQFTTEDYNLDKPIKRAEAAKIIYTLKLFSLRPDLSPAERQEIKEKHNIPVKISRSYMSSTYQPDRYSDVKSSDWFANYVETLTKWHIISGDEFSNTFRPGDSLNNAESIKIIISSYLSGGLYDHQGPIQYGTDLNTQKESAKYFQNKYNNNLNNIKNGFTHINDKAWYITYLAEADAKGLSANQASYTTSNSIPAIHDSTTREDFILWAMRIYSSDVKNSDQVSKRFLVDKTKNFTFGQDNLSIKNRSFLITLGDIIHAFDLRYTIPAKNQNFNNKRYFFEGEEMQLDYYKNDSGQLDPAKLDKTLEKYSIRNQKGQKLNSLSILNNWDRVIQGGNCSSFVSISASLFNNYSQINNYITSQKYDNPFQIQETDFEQRKLNTLDSEQKNYLINMADQIRIKWLITEFSGSPKNENKYVTPKELVTTYQSFFNRNPNIDYSKGFHFIPYTNGYKMNSGEAHSLLFYSYQKVGQKHLFRTYDANFPDDNNLYFVVTENHSDDWTVEYLRKDKSGNFHKTHNPEELERWEINKNLKKNISISKIDFLANTKYNLNQDWLK